MNPERKASEHDVKHHPLGRQADVGPTSHPFFGLLGDRRLFGGFPNLLQVS